MARTSCITELNKYKEKFDKIIHKQWLHVIKEENESFKIQNTDTKINNDKYKKAFNLIFSD